jgi:hypothetical protein
MTDKSNYRLGNFEAGQPGQNKTRQLLKMLKMAENAGR